MRADFSSSTEDATQTLEEHLGTMMDEGTWQTSVIPARLYSILVQMRNQVSSIETKAPVEISQSVLDTLNARLDRNRRMENKTGAVNMPLTPQEAGQLIRVQYDA